MIQIPSLVVTPHGITAKNTFEEIFDAIDESLRAHYKNIINTTNSHASDGPPLVESVFEERLKTIIRYAAQVVANNLYSADRKNWLSDCLQNYTFAGKQVFSKCDALFQLSVSYLGLHIAIMQSNSSQDGIVRYIRSAEEAAIKKWFDSVCTSNSQETLYSLWRSIGARIHASEKAIAIYDSDNALAQTAKLAFQAHKYGLDGSEDALNTAWSRAYSDYIDEKYPSYQSML